MHPILNSVRGYRNVLIVLFSLFCFRVAAQAVQLIYPLPFIPAFADWHSGALPYGLLLLSQLIIIVLCLKVIYSFRGDRISPSLKSGKLYLILGCLYFSVKMVRIIGGFTFAADVSWFQARIPAFFHLVLASFLIVLGFFHYKFGKTPQR